MKNWTRQDKYWAATVVLAFVGIISFFQVNSYFADKNNINWLFKVIGTVGVVGALYCVYKGVANPPGSNP